MNCNINDRRTTEICPTGKPAQYNELYTAHPVLYRRHSAAENREKERPREREHEYDGLHTSVTTQDWTVVGLGGTVNSSARQRNGTNSHAREHTISLYGDSRLPYMVTPGLLPGM